VLAGAQLRATATVFIAASKMECPKPSAVSALVLLVHVIAAEPGIALKLEPTGTSSHIPPLLDCAPAPAGAAPSNNLSAFRNNVLAVLGALPAAAAAVPTGFVAAAQSGGAVGDDRAFARAFWFGFGARRRGSFPGDNCLECLSAAAQDVADGCHGRRGAVWRAGCFLSYADTNTSTPREDAWRGWFYDDDTPPAAELGTCVANRTAAECSRCLNESAQVVPALKEGRQLSLVHGDAVVVVGYSCYLRVPLFPPPTTRLPVWVDYGELTSSLFPPFTLETDISGS
jgi:hypothetical protein